MKDKVFRGFIIAASLAMILIVYGTFAANMTLIVISEVSGLAASGVGWLGFVRDLKSDSKNKSEQ